MKIYKVIIALDEKIFLEYCKTLEIKNIKTNEDVILAEKERINQEEEEESLVILYGKDTQKIVDYIKNSFIMIDKIIVVNFATVMSNDELVEGNVIIPNTFIRGEGGDGVIFLEEIVGNDYEFDDFGLILSGICADSKSIEEKNEDFIADIVSERIFIYLKLLQKEDLLEKVITIVGINEKSILNMIAVSNMSLG